MEKICITNTTRMDFSQHMHYKSTRVIDIPAYALNHEITFESKEELELFYKLCDGKISNGELIIGKTNSSKAEKENEKVESKEQKNKQEVNEKANQEFDDAVKTQLGDQGAEVKISTEKSKKSRK